jgi:hypothetical protein
MSQGRPGDDWRMSADIAAMDARTPLSQWGCPQLLLALLQVVLF